MAILLKTELSCEFRLAYSGGGTKLEQLQRLAEELEHTHPGAAASLREGMEETLTVIRLRIKGKLKRTLESTTSASR